MFGGIAVTGNLLCVAYGDTVGKLFLVDVEERRLMTCVQYSGKQDGYADAGGVAMTADFTIFVADTRNDIVRRFTAFGKEVGTLGRPADRPPGAARRDRTGILDRPRAVAVFDGTVFVACGERRLVRGVQRFHTDGSLIRPLRAFGEDERHFGAPRGLHASRDGVFVADTLHGVVQRFAPTGQFVCEVPTALNGECSRPVAVLPIDGGELLVADQGDFKVVKRVALDGARREMVPQLVALDEPQDLARDERGRIYVLDRGGERVQRFDPELRLEGVIVDLAEFLRAQ